MRFAQRDGVRKLEVRSQTTASQMVNLSNSQMVMNGVNDGLTISRFDQLTLSTT